MSCLSIVGIGMGITTLTQSAIQTIQKADVVFGARRMLSAAEGVLSERPMSAGSQTTRIPEYDPVRVAGWIDEHRDFNSYVLLVSGDTGFYSAAAAMIAEYHQTLRERMDLEVIPGLSSASYFFAKCGKSWQDARLISCHGRAGNIVAAVRRNRDTFALTGNNTKELAERLELFGFGDLNVFVGENLGSDSERIESTTVSSLRHEEHPGLTVLLIENPDPDRRLNIGIPDDAFIRGDVPMTKAEVRAVIMSKLEISPTDICLDIGCGTGSVTVEMGLAAYEGRVYGFDVSEEAVSLTAENLKRFRIGEAEAVFGKAPDCLHTEAFSGVIPDVAFIGGTKGKMAEIVNTLYDRNPGVRICMTAIAIETAVEAMNALRSCGLDAEMVQIQTARAKKVAGLHMMMGQNPIFVISTTRGGDR